MQRIVSAVQRDSVRDLQQELNRHGHEAVAQYRDESGNTLLHVAMQSHSYHCAIELLQREVILPSTRQSVTGELVVHQASALDYLPILHMVREYDAAHVSLSTAGNTALAGTVCLVI